MYLRKERSNEFFQILKIKQQYCMNNPIWSSLIAALFLCGIVTSLPVDNIVIGIFTQNYWYEDHKPVNGATLTYLYPSYTNLASMTGAKAVPIYSYTSKEEILAQLAKVNGVIFSGGEQYININNTWTTNALTVLQYAMNENDAGRTFPILGICQGLELLLYLTSDKRVDFLDPIQSHNGVWDVMTLVSNDYYLIDGVSDKTLQAITDPTKTPEGGPMFFFHSNGTLLSTFQKDQDLNTFWNLIGQTTKANQTFVTYLEAKRYPFYITQFHPQRLTFSANLSDQLYYARGELSTTIALNFGMKCKQNPHRYSRDQLIVDIVDNYPLVDSIKFTDLKVYLFNEWGPSTIKRDPEDGQYMDLVEWAGVIAFMGLFVVVSYLMFRKRKAQRMDDRENEVLSPTPRQLLAIEHRSNDFVNFRSLNRDRV